MTALYVVAVPAVLGWLALRALGLRWRDEPLGGSAAAWLLGCLALGAGVQGGIELELAARWWPIAPLVGLGGLALWRRRTGASPVAPVAARSPGGGFPLFVAAGVVLCVLFAAAGLDRPCLEGDEGNIWSLKGKSLLCDWPDRFAEAQIHNLHPDYPQLNPLLQAWTYAVFDAPEFAQFANRALVQLCDVALFVATAAALRRALPALPAALLASLVLFEPVFQELLRTAYADGMVALGMVVALDAWLRWRAHGDRRCGWLAGLALAFALWSKNEAMLYLLGAAGAALVLRAWRPSQRGGVARTNLLLLAPAALVIANNIFWNLRFGTRSDLLGANPTGKSMFTLMAEQAGERGPAMLAEAAALVASPAHAHVVFAVLLLGVLAAPARGCGHALALPGIALFAAFAGLHAVYVGSFLPLRFHLDTSYARVLFQLLPAALVLLAALAAEVVAARRPGDTASRS